MAQRFLPQCRHPTKAPKKTEKGKREQESLASPSSEDVWHTYCHQQMLASEWGEATARKLTRTSPQPRKKSKTDAAKQMLLKILPDQVSGFEFPMSQFVRQEFFGDSRKRCRNPMINSWLSIVRFPGRHHPQSPRKSETHTRLSLGATKSRDICSARNRRHTNLRN